MRKMTPFSNVIQMTPYQVAIWFQESQDLMLQQIGRDLEPATFGNSEGFHIPTDLVACLLHLPEICQKNGKFKRGANATIAQVVFGNRARTGGAYNTRIQVIKSQLTAMFVAVNATTTSPEPQPPQEVALRAA